MSRKVYLMKAVPVSRYLVFFLIVLLGFGADLWSKSYMFSWLGMPDGAKHWVIEGVFGFETSLNEGALFGFGQGAVGWFAVFSIVAFLGILVWLFIFGAARNWVLTISLSFISVGTLGNLYDRLGLHDLEWNYPVEGLHQVGEPVYAVRDWIMVMIGSWPWPNFNIADVMLVTGAILLGIHTLFVVELEEKEEKTEEEKAVEEG